MKEAQGATSRQLVSYDSFGNLTNLTTAGSSFPIPVSASTNRLLGPGTTYRADGSLSTITLGGEPIVYTFDGLGKMKYLQTQGEARVFFYDASDDRLLAWDCPSGDCDAASRYLRWTVRGLSGELLRAYGETRRDNRRWLEDFVYQNGRLLAAARRNDSGGEDRFAFALDHLSSTRQIYDWSGNLVESHSYYPFGQEVGAAGATDFVQKFTGHERDPNSFGMGQLDCQNFGNYVWGMLAAASGIPLQIAQRGAGLYSAIGPNARPEWTLPIGSTIPLVNPPYGDDPNDSYWIEVGWLEYQNIQYEIPRNR